jgi:hypothetical protein
VKLDDQSLGLGPVQVFADDERVAVVVDPPNHTLHRS